MCDAITTSVMNYLAGCTGPPDPDALRQVTAGALQGQLTTLWQAPDRNWRLYEAYVACFPDAIQALLFLSYAADIGVAYIDRAVIEDRVGRTLSDDEWERVALLLDGYDEHVSSWCDVNSEFMRDILRRSGVDGNNEPDTTHEDPQPVPVHAPTAAMA
ncbi:hypothetical protein GCM10009661_74780 [Catellatospora chokoriensis]|uniref:Uncharacterized protein n=2 Tax=Catellatospora chokoriensis TaxID=310353 RepID=A0A8J3KFD0_9ACTN|nr:hypothetical protein Cch02nite_74730 [Catellatospora chokoriensis]